VACIERPARAAVQGTAVGGPNLPRAPTAGNEKILWRLLGHYSDHAALIDATAGLGDRWVLITANGEEKFLFNDTLGLRQIFYIDPCETGAVW